MQLSIDARKSKFKLRTDNTRKGEINCDLRAITFLNIVAQALPRTDTDTWQLYYLIPIMCFIILRVPHIFFGIPKFVYALHLQGSYLLKIEVFYTPCKEDQGKYKWSSVPKYMTFVNSRHL